MVNLRIDLLTSAMARSGDLEQKKTLSLDEKVRISEPEDCFLRFEKHLEVVSSWGCGGGKRCVGRWCLCVWCECRRRRCRKNRFCSSASKTGASCGGEPSLPWHLLFACSIFKYRIIKTRVQFSWKVLSTLLWKQGVNVELKEVAIWTRFLKPAMDWKGSRGGQGESWRVAEGTVSEIRKWIFWPTNCNSQARETSSKSSLKDVASCIDSGWFRSSNWPLQVGVGAWAGLLRKKLSSSRKGFLTSWLRLCHSKIGRTLKGI